MPKSGRERLGIVALVVLSPIAFWGSLELACLTLGVPALSDNEAYIHYAAQRDCEVGWRAAESTCAAALFEHSGRRLLVTLGGSSVFGYPPGITPFASQLDRLLKRAAPKTWRVVNRGSPCKNSYFVQDCARRAIGGGAEVLVIYAGHNDFATYGVWNPSRRIWLEKNGWLYEVEVLLTRSRAFSALIGMMRGDTKRLWFPRQPDSEQIRDSEEIVLEAYTRNLESVITAAAKQGTKIILSTVVSNLYEYPVKREDWDSSPLYDPGRRPDLVPWAERYREGISRHRAGDFEAALSAFTKARDHFWNGRAPTRLNERVRTLAARHPHVELVDVERILQLNPSEGVGCNFFGDDSYCDQFHPNARTHALIAGALLEKLREMQLVPAQSTKRR